MARNTMLPGVTRRRLSATLGALAPALAACSGTGASGGQAAPQASRPVTITAWFPVQVTATSRYSEFLAEQSTQFQQGNPKVKVTIEPPGAADKLQAAIVAGDPPDIQQSNYIPMFDWAQKGALEPVDQYLDKRGKGDFLDWARDGSTIQGRMFEWPWMMNPVGPVLNKSLFDQKNIASLLPKQGLKADWTIEQWMNCLRAVTTRTGNEERDVFGTCFIGTSTWYTEMMYLWGLGAEIYDKDEKRVVINSPEGIQGLQMLVDLVLRDRVAVPNPEQLNINQAIDLYLAKRIAILNGSNAQIGEAEKRLKDGTILPPLESMFMPPPHAPGKKPATFVAIQSFLVFKQDRDKDRTLAAMQLGFHLTDTPAQKAITILGELPVRKSPGNIYADDINRTTGFAAIENGRSMGRFPDNGQIRNLWQTAVRAAFTRERSPKDALDELVRQSEPIMAKYR